MNSKTIIFVLSLIALSVAMPVEDDNSSAERGLSSTNWLYQQINDVLKRDIEKHTNKTASLDVGDKIKGDGFSINVQQFGAGNDFPVHFRPQDSAGHPDVLESATVIALVDDFDGSSEFVIRQKSSEESSEESKETTAKVATTSSSGSSTTATPSTTASSTEATTTTTKKN